ncbi:hypothetical protein OG226_12145 [Streptomyces sp. NBC_01261]|uniref:hypothetical protein n=1 Tax=Streptomyces sp. NBC_01261 TaxID=2903802 RepID=UPI002E32924A|nr:hypothetical protein [Streptomyces sp. NBC_01261]
MKGVGGFAKGGVRQTECVVHHPRRCFPGIPGIGLFAKVLGPVQEGELVRHCSESGCRFAGRLYSGGETGDDPRSVGLLVLGDSPEEDLVAQVGYQLAEFGDLLGDGDAVG